MFSRALSYEESRGHCKTRSHVVVVVNEGQTVTAVHEVNCVRLVPRSLKSSTMADSVSSDKKIQPMIQCDILAPWYHSSCDLLNKDDVER